LRPEARFALGALATWRVTHLVACEDGPGDVIVQLRARLGDSQLGRLMDCFACTSVWVAAGFARMVARDPRDVALVWPALSGAACLLERITPAPAAEGLQGGDDVLWEQARGVQAVS
jgi:hypothetical protein